MAETGKNTVGDALANLEPQPKPRSEKRAAIEANREAIYAAKDRGCSWGQIAEAFAEVGLVVTADALRFAINAVLRDFKKYPRRSIAQKRRGRQSSVSTGKIQAGAADEERNDDRSVPKPEEATYAPASIPPRIDPNSNVIRRLNMKV